MKALRTAALITVSVLIVIKVSLGADDEITKVPSPDLLSRLRYKSLLIGGAEIRLGMSSNDFTTAIAKANLHGMWMVTSPDTPSIGVCNVSGTNSLERGALKGVVYFRDGVAICIDRAVASFRDDDRGTDFARRLVELLWTVQMEKGTERIVNSAPLVLGDHHALTFDVVPGNKRISCSAQGGKFLMKGEVKDSFAPPQAEISESIYCLDSMSEISDLPGIRKFWGNQ